MTKLTMEKMKHPFGQQLVLKIAGRTAKYQSDVDFDVSKISNLNIDDKNHVIYEVMDTVENGRKQFSHKKSKKFNKLIELWGKMKADYKNKDNYKSNSDCKQIFNKLIKMDYFHHVELIEDFIATNCFIPGIDECMKIQKDKKMNKFISVIIP